MDLKIDTHINLESSDSGFLDDLSLSQDDLLDSSDFTVRSASQSPTDSNSADTATSPSGQLSGFKDSYGISTSSTGSNGNASSAPLSRRPSTRKTLTQQQKNNKRQRATSEQLAILEAEFAVNPAPNAKTRMRVADQINMTERSVQIWFQNRRAKIKLLAKKSIETGEDYDLIPDSMKQYLAVQSTGPRSGTSNTFFARAFGMDNPREYLGRSASYGGISDRSFIMPGTGGMVLTPPEASSGKTLVNRFTCRSLTIGTWRRVSCMAMDLVTFYSPSQSQFTYYIKNESIGFKIEYPFSFIKQIYVEAHPATFKQENNITDENRQSAELGDIVIHLLRRPFFFMESLDLNGGWIETEDFTEGQQASKVFEHRLTGPLKVLEHQLAELLCQKTDHSRTRTVRSNSTTSSMSNSSSSLANQTYTSSAPVSPLDTAASIMPLTPMPTTVEDPSTINQSRPFPHTHKRNRSRSVPIAIDLAHLNLSGVPGFRYPPTGLQAQNSPSQNLVLVSAPTSAPSIPTVSSAIPLAIQSQMVAPGVAASSTSVRPTSIPTSAPATAMAQSSVPRSSVPATTMLSTQLNLDMDLAATPASMDTSELASMRPDANTQYFDMYSFPMSTTSSNSGFQSPPMMNGVPHTPLITANVTGGSIPSASTPTSLTGDMVNMHPFGATNIWLENSLQTNDSSMPPITVNAVTPTPSSSAAETYDLSDMNLYSGINATSSSVDHLGMHEGQMFQDSFVKLRVEDNGGNSDNASNVASTMDMGNYTMM
ncbi:hypothetical protein V1511DRAFT_511354 [Dipodascopsis uninucleata]